MKKNASTLTAKAVIVFLSFLWSCNASSSKSIAEQASFSNEWPKIIQSSKIGLVSTGIKIKDALGIISEYFEVKPDSIMNSDEEYTFFYKVKDQQGQYIFNIHPAPDKGNGREFVYSYEVFNNEYIIDKTNICVGKDVNEIKKHFKLSSTYFDFDSGLFLFVSDFNGSFNIELDSISKNSLGESNFETPEDVPGYFKIKSIIIY